MPSLDENLLPRREDESGSKRILAVSVAILGIAALVGGLWIAYSAGVKNTGGSAPPLVRAPDTPAKTTPTDPGGMQVANQGAEVFGTIQRGGQRPLPQGTESILPAPEQPLPQAPPPPPPEAPAATVTIPAPGLPQPNAAPAPAQATEVPKAAPQPPVQTAPPASSPPPAVAAPATPAALPAGTVRIQVGAHRDRPTAEQEWSRLSRRFPDVLGGLSPVYERADLGERGVFIRIQTGLRDRATADRACERLKAEKQVCAIVGR